MEYTDETVAGSWPGVRVSIDVFLRNVGPRQAEEWAREASRRVQTCQPTVEGVMSSIHFYPSLDEYTETLEVFEEAASEMGQGVITPTNNPLLVRCVVGCPDDICDDDCVNVIRDDMRWAKESGVGAILANTRGDILVSRNIYPILGFTDDEIVQTRPIKLAEDPVNAKTLTMWNFVASGVLSNANNCWLRVQNKEGAPVNLKIAMFKTRQDLVLITIKKATPQEFFQGSRAFSQHWNGVFQPASLDV